MSENMRSGPVVVAIGNFEYTGGFRFETTRIKRYTSSFPNEYVLTAGDVLLAMTCQTSGGEILGIPGVIPADGNMYLHNQRLGKVILKSDSEIELDFLYWLFLSPQFNQHLYLTATGTKILHTSPNKIESYEFLLPPKRERQTIASMLWSLENKIQLNRQINTTQKSMAQALFKSWFVDFDPVIDNALAVGNPIPDELQAKAEVRAALGEQRKPLPESIRQQFPNRFVLTEEMGWVPEGWQISSVGEQVQTVGGGTPKTNDPSFWDGGSHAFCTPKDMSKLNSLVLMSTDRRLTDAGVAKVSSGLLPRGTVLMSSRAPIGYLAISDIAVAVNQGVIAMLPSAEYGPLYLLLWAQENMRNITDRANGSTFLEISKKNFRPIPFLVPTKTVLKYFNKQAEGIYQRVLLTSEQTEKLAATRDALLPKLLSGELRVPEAEITVEEALADA